MPISSGSGTAAEYKAALNQVLYYLYQNFGGLDHHGLQSYGKLTFADLRQILADFYVYKQARENTPLDGSNNIIREAFPTAHGAANTTFQDGLGTEKPAVVKASDY